MHIVKFNSRNSDSGFLYVSMHLIYIATSDPVYEHFRPSATTGRTGRGAVSMSKLDDDASEEGQEEPAET